MDAKAVTIEVVALVLVPTGSKGAALISGLGLAEVGILLLLIGIILSRGSGLLVFGAPSEDSTGCASSVPLTILKMK